MFFEEPFDLLNAVHSGGVDLEMIPLDVADALARLEFLQGGEKPFVGLTHHPAHRFIGLVEALRSLPALMLVEVEPPVLYVGDNGHPRENRSHLVPQPRDAVGIRGQKDQAVLFLARLLASTLQDRSGCIGRWSLGRPAEGRRLSVHDSGAEPRDARGGRPPARDRRQAEAARQARIAGKKAAATRKRNTTKRSDQSSGTSAEGVKTWMPPKTPPAKRNLLLMNG